MQGFPLFRSLLLRDFTVLLYAAPSCGFLQQLIQFSCMMIQVKVLLASCFKRHSTVQEDRLHALREKLIAAV